MLLDKLMIVLINLVQNLLKCAPATETAICLPNKI